MKLYADKVTKNKKELKKMTEDIDERIGLLNQRVAELEEKFEKIDTTCEFCNRTADGVLVVETARGDRRICEDCYDRVHKQFFTCGVE